MNNELKMIIKIFYSWQSDLPNKYNRGFILTCLKKAIKLLNSNIEIDFRVDKDTQDVYGTPDIVNTIFGKIKQAQIFVADISIINLFENNTSRRVPNPNVLLELGYAAATHGWENMILFYNLDFSRIEDLPFDLKLRRPLFYSYGPDSEKNKGQQEKIIINILVSSISDMIAKMRNFQNHPVTKLYPFYHSKINRIFHNTDHIFNELIDYWNIDHENESIFPVDHENLNKIINEINERFKNVKWDQKKRVSYTDPNSVHFEELFLDYISNVKSNIDSLINIREGLDIGIINLLLEISLALEESSFFGKPGYGYSFQKGDDYTLYYLSLTKDKIMDLVENVYELRNRFVTKYAPHKEEYFKQKREILKKRYNF